jgi:hypothetical protein
MRRKKRTKDKTKRTATPSEDPKDTKDKTSKDKTTK